MTIEQAMKHPTYKNAYNYAQSQGFRGGMNDTDFGWVVTAYLAGYNKGKKMIYKGIDIERRECTFIPGPHLRLCGYDHDYGLFRTKHPRDLAVFMIHQVFSEEEIKSKRFIYAPRTYRGRQSMQDTLTIYFQEKTRY